MRYLTVLLLALVFVVGDVHAQQGTYGVNLGGGPARALGEGSEDMNLGASLVGGVSYGITNNLRAVTDVSYTVIRIKDSVFEDTPFLYGGGTSITGITGGLRAGNASAPFELFLQAGGGFSRVKTWVFAINDIENVEKGGLLYVGGGAKISFTNVFGLQLTANYSRTMGVGEDAFEWMPVRLNLVFNTR